MIHGHFGCQLGDGRQDAKCIGGQKHDVLGMPRDTGNASVVDMIDRICGSRVFRDFI